MDDEIIARVRAIKHAIAARYLGSGVLLLPVDDPWRLLEDALAEFQPGFQLERAQPDPQQRDAIEP